MYNERKESFSIRDIIIEVLFVLLFVFLLLWLFPSKSYIKNNTSVSGESSKQVTDAIFAYNVQTMKEAAISYFTTPRLPQSVGDSTTLTLKQMLDEKLLLPFVDSEGKTCDLDNSYVQMTKVKDEYSLKVNLTCPSMSDYIIVHLGCYDYCKGSVCEKKEEKPNPPTKDAQYKYVLNIKGVCTTSAWSNWGLTAISKSDTVEVETKVENGSCKGYSSSLAIMNPTYTGAGSYTIASTCPNSDDWISNGMCIDETNKYVKLVSSTVCDSGYSYDSSVKRCVKNSASDAVLKTTCPSGYSYNETKKLCVATSGTAAIATTTGGTSYWTTPVTKVYSESKVSTSTVKYSNLSVYYGIGSCNGCTYSINYVYDVSELKTTAGTTTYSCKNSSDIRDGKTCYATTKATTSYKCKKSTSILKGDKCYATTDAYSTYTCSVSGYTYDAGRESCIRQVKPTCTSGVLSSDGKTCTVITIATPTCGSGYTYNQTTGKCETYVTGSCNSYEKVTLYRSRTKTCTNDTTDIKYSKSNNDQDLIKKGYKLVGQV